MSRKKDDTRVFLDIHYKNGDTQRVVSNTKRRFLSRIQAVPATEVAKYTVRVSYLTGKHNEFEATSKKEVREKYKIFTAKPEIEFIRNYWRK